MCAKCQRTFAYCGVVLKLELQVRNVNALKQGQTWNGIWFDITLLEHITAMDNELSMILWWTMCPHFTYTRFLVCPKAHFLHQY